MSKLLDLLAERHANDVFVPECKDGPTQLVTHNRMDAWVLISSWASPCTIGYECKVSRSDFVRDNKWRNYLPLCNQFYFVCPAGLIDAAELPAEVGLLWASKNWTRLYAKRKAAYRDVEIPEDLYRYVLMCRSKITRERSAGLRAFWERWLEDRTADHEFGHRVRGRIAKHYRERVLAVETENDRLTRVMETYEKIRRMLAELGLNADNPSEWRAREKIEEMRSAIPVGLVHQLDQLVFVAGAAKEALEKLQVAPQV